MLIVYDQNFPLIVFKITDFNELEYKTLKKELLYFNNKAEQNTCFIKLYIDLYSLQSYSNYYITSIIKFVNENNFSRISSVRFFIDKNNTGYILKAGFYISNSLAKIPIELIELDKPKQWK